MARVTGLEPATSSVTGKRSNQLNYTRIWLGRICNQKRPGFQAFLMPNLGR